MSTPQETACSLLRALGSVLALGLPASERPTPLDCADLVAQVFNLAADHCQANNLSRQAMAQALAYLERRNQVPRGTLRTWHQEGRYALEAGNR